MTHIARRHTPHNAPQIGRAERPTQNDGTSATPTLANITRHGGVVGEYSYTVDVSYPGQPTDVVQFSTGTFGNTYSVLMITTDKTEYVSEAWRYGTPLGPDWIRKYYSSDQSRA